jgi:hypothetical protein
MMSSVPETYAMDQHLVEPPPTAEQEQLCYVHCNYCDTILAVRKTSFLVSSFAQRP